MKIEELNRILVDFIRDNVPHPDLSGNKKWIYMDYPRPDATFPRISITQVMHSQRPAGIGEKWISSKGEWQDTTYDIDIWVKKGNHYQIDSVPSPEHAGTALRDYLGDYVIQVIIDGRKWFKDNKEIADIRILGSNTVPYMDVNELFRRTVSIRVSYFRTKVDSP